MDLSALSSVVQTIGGQLIQEVTSLLGVKDQVEDLQRELIWMQSFLKDADARKVDSEVVRTCVAEIRELAYDAEDVIESFALKVASRRTSFIKRSACILKEGKLLRQTKSEIERITARITNLTRRLQTYDVKRLGDGEGSSSSTERVEKRRPYPHIIEDNIVGLDDDIKKLVPVLVDGESDCRVVSICGMGGLGKTTLAKKIYHHSQVINHFSCLAWVYVSQQFNKRKVWEDILSGLKILGEGDRNKRDEEIAEKLSKFLEANKCLVILDDIWRMEAWDSLKPAFPVGDTMRSKILLTSRNKEVVSYADRRGYLYELQCLNAEQSWELFQKIAFPPTDSTDYSVDERMEEMGRNMVKHCGGLPLAIIVLGGILITKNSFDEWQMVFDNVKSHLKRGKSQSTEDVLALSYDDLPPYLRPCFLYLSHFPEDYGIKAQRLIQLWVAEGIVSSKQEGNGGEIMEHEAEGYLNELAERCMIQVRERKGAYLKIKTFQMHDLMRDFCLAKAKQENFFFIMDEPVKYLRGRNVQSSAVHNVRRVVGYTFYEIPRIRSPHLRSLFLFTRSLPGSYMSTFEPLPTLTNYIINHEDRTPLVWIAMLLAVCILIPEVMGICKYMVNNFKFLRVLHYEGDVNDSEPKLPSDIGKFVHLRYLSLRDVLFCYSKLPSSLGNLRCLQTLNLRVKREICSGSVQVPNVIWRMQELRHLYLPKKCTRKPKLKLGTLRKLQTLVNFSTRNCHVEDLLNLTSLRELKIRLPFNIKDFKEDLEMNPPILASKYLRSLSIKGSDFEQVIDPRHLAHLLSSCVNICELSSRVKIGKLPELHHFSSNIACIHLRRSDLEEDPMPTLEKLPNLRMLELHDNAFTGKKMVCSAQGFPKLDSLSLSKLDNLEEWKADEGAMPTLHQLEISKCYNLQNLPDGLRFITTLKKLKIERMRKEFKDKVVEGGEDFYKVQHVPSTIF